MQIILFEDDHVAQLYPVTLARQAFAIHVGAYRLIDIAREFARQNGGQVEAVVRPYLRDITKKDFPDLRHTDTEKRSAPILVINARMVPDYRMFEQIVQKAKILAQDKRSAVIRSKTQTSQHTSYTVVAAAVFAGQDQDPFPAGFNDHPHCFNVSNIVNAVKSKLLNIEIQGYSHVPMLAFPHDITKYNEEIMPSNLECRLRSGLYKEVADGVFSADGNPLGAYCVTDSTKGPVIFEPGAHIGPFCFFRGPVHVGANSKIIEHAALKDCVSLGDTVKIGGEVETSVIESYSNKQHHGFLGHSYLGSWVNLGAGTSNSDLKNTYGKIRMRYDGKEIETGMQFVGCFIGDYTRTAINTSIFTGKTVGAGCMLYGSVTTDVPSFVNHARIYGQVTRVDPKSLLKTQEQMFKRRGLTPLPCDKELIENLYTMTEHERKKVIDWLRL